MTQLIITWIIIALAVGFSVLLIIRRFRRKKRAKDICTGCSSDCESCGFYKELYRKK